MNYLRDIWVISNKEYQKRIWIRAEGPEVDDFDETCCHFFDDGDPILDKYQEYHISESQHKILKKFRDEFEVFSDEHYWPPDFIDTPEWGKIMEMAKEVLQAFDYKQGF